VLACTGLLSFPDNCLREFNISMGQCEGPFCKEDEVQGVTSFDEAGVSLRARHRGKLTGCKDDFAHLA